MHATNQLSSIQYIPIVNRQIRSWGVANNFIGLGHQNLGPKILFMYIMHVKYEYILLALSF